AAAANDNAPAASSNPAAPPTAGPGSAVAAVTALKGGAHPRTKQVSNARMAEIAREIPFNTPEYEAAARRAAEEAGIDYVPMSGTREEIIARLVKYDWTPSEADLQHAKDAAAAAKAENLVPNETVTSQVFFTKPAVDMSGANTDMYGALIDQIEHAQKIHASLYGIDSVPELVQALRDAKARGAEIKLNVDQNPDGTFTYPGTQALIDEFGTDVVRVERTGKYAIMHDKFWIFDDEKVWTGSTNINASAIGKGYNNEVSVLVDSKNLAATFEAEHAQQWAGFSHAKKQAVGAQNQIPQSADGVGVEAYFSPKEDAITKGILPQIEAAQTSMHLSLFHFSDPKLAQAMIDAKNRGVDVKMIIDASGAANAATRKNVELLRAAGIPVKVENWGGKQHMKGGVIDGKNSIIGSMNWTNSGAKKNDENVLIFKNDAALGARMDEQFADSFASLPTLTLFGYFAAEGLNSISTMVDGSDNDHFGGKDPYLSWQQYTKALGEISTAAVKMAAAEGADLAIEAKEQALGILRGEVNKAKARLIQWAGGTKADLVISKIDADLDSQISKHSL
ncbi:MAG TPA: phospholipase D-like domain-containing protein, partial [Planctomycetota bacterium]|nr:phospholipase D-like domain-containing protein [Planctomycetota bacterium]